MKLPRRTPRAMAARGAVMQAAAAILFALAAAPIVQNTTFALHSALGRVWPFSLERPATLQWEAAAAAPAWARR